MRPPHFAEVAVVGKLQAGAVVHRPRFKLITDGLRFGQPHTRGAVFARCAPYPADEDDVTPRPPEAASFSAGWADRLGAQPCLTCYPKE